MRTRSAIVIEPGDQHRIIGALESCPDQHGFVRLRTRALVYLLWDGAMRTGPSLWLDIEEVVKDPDAARIQIVQEAVQRPCAGNQQRERRFLMGDRVRQALADYLKEARSGGWLANGARLAGPLWIATHHRGEQKRMSRRTAMAAWRTFMDSVRGLSCEHYQLDDVVQTGRVAFLRAAKSTVVMSEHAGISAQWASNYSRHLQPRLASARDVMSQLNQQYKRKP